MINNDFKQFIELLNKNSVKYLAWFSHHLSTAATLCRTLLDFHSVRALNIV